MSHNILVNMIVDQEIEILGQQVNVHDIEAIEVDAYGKIIDAYLKPRPEPEKYKGWLSVKNLPVGHRG